MWAEISFCGFSATSVVYFFTKILKSSDENFLLLSFNHLSLYWAVLIDAGLGRRQICPNKETIFAFNIRQKPSSHIVHPTDS